MAEEAEAREERKKVRKETKMAVAEEVAATEEKKQPYEVLGKGELLVGDLGGLWRMWIP